MYPFEEAAGMLKVIAHPVRINILVLLERGRMNVMEIQHRLGIKQSITSQHLGVMAGKGILKREKEANQAYYSIKKKQVLKLLSCIKGCCDNRQDR